MSLNADLKQVSDTNDSIIYSPRNSQPRITPKIVMPTSPNIQQRCKIVQGKDQSTLQTNRFVMEHLKNEIYIQEEDPLENTINRNTFSQKSKCEMKGSISPEFKNV